MSVRIIDYPRCVDVSSYHQALQAMTQRLLQTGSVVAVYQLGGVGSPGISDLDMLVVFKDGARVGKNFLDGLGKEERYLFIHNLYGISLNNFAGAEQFAFYHAYELQGGEEVRSQQSLNGTDVQVLKTQIALEYVVKMRITLFLQSAYGVIRMRDLLLHVRALQYDLDFLGCRTGVMPEHVSRVLEWRKNWFISPPSREEIRQWWGEFYSSFDLFFEELLGLHPFFLPVYGNCRIAKNILLIPSAGKISFSRQGYVLPALFSLAGKKFFRLQNKLNHFQFEIPVQSGPVPDVIEKKFNFEKTIVDYNKKYLPHFLPLTSSLHFI